MSCTVARSIITVNEHWLLNIPSNRGRVSRKYCRYSVNDRSILSARDVNIDSKWYNCSWSSALALFRSLVFFWSLLRLAVLYCESMSSMVFVGPIIVRIRLINSNRSDKHMWFASIINCLLIRTVSFMLKNDEDNAKDKRMIPRLSIMVIEENELLFCCVITSEQILIKSMWVWLQECDDASNSMVETIKSIAERSSKLVKWFSWKEMVLLNDSRYAATACSMVPISVDGRLCLCEWMVRREELPSLHHRLMTVNLCQQRPTTGLRVVGLTAAAHPISPISPRFWHWFLPNSY